MYTRRKMASSILIMMLAVAAVIFACSTASSIHAEDVYHITDVKVSDQEYDGKMHNAKIEAYANINGTTVIVPENQLKVTGTLASKEKGRHTVIIKGAGNFKGKFVETWRIY